MGPGGLEPPTSRLSGVHSNQLSYGPASHGRVDSQRDGVNPLGQRNQLLRC